VKQKGGKAISLQTDLESVLVSTDRTIPIGLMVNELVMNAVKYAFPGETGGSVLVAFKREFGHLRLTVSDDGRGSASHPTDSGLGSRLVDGFAQQLGASSGRVTTVAPLWA
jgi:two-component sensor histidine kinase